MPKRSKTSKGKGNHGTLYLDGSSLTIHHVFDIAHHKHLRVCIDPKSEQRIIDCRNTVEKLTASGKIVYGLTTGFGSFKDKVISSEQTKQLQQNLVRSHSIGVGEPFSEAEVRAAMLIRANSLVKGYSGIRLSAIQTLLDILNAGIYPYVPQKGSVGSSGDLAPLSHLALVLIGEGEVLVDGKRVPARRVLKEKGIKPLVLQSKEGLAFNNGTSFLTAVAALNVARAEQLIVIADSSLAMSLEALGGTLAAYDPRVHELRAHPGQIETARKIRELCKGSTIVGPGNGYKTVQDSYTLRCSPQVHGAVRENLNYVRKVIEVEINSVTDNPLVFADAEEAVSGGNFHGEPVSLVMDTLAISMTELSNISERRIAKILDMNNNNGLPAFLIEPKNAGLSSGYMIAQYTAAALVAENKVLAHPVVVDSIPTSSNQEDYVSFGTTASRKCRDIIENVKNVLAIELMCASQGLDFRKPRKPGKKVLETYKKVRSAVPHLEEDRILYKDLEKIMKVL